MLFYITQHQRFSKVRGREKRKLVKKVVQDTKFSSYLLLLTFLSLFFGVVVTAYGAGFGMEGDRLALLGYFAISTFWVLGYLLKLNTAVSRYLNSDNHPDVGGR